MSASTVCNGVLSFPLSTVTGNVGPAGVGWNKVVIETLVPTSVNTLPNLTSTIDATVASTGFCLLIINQQCYVIGTHFTVATKTITWLFDAAAGGFDIATTDQVIAIYVKQ